MVVASSSSSPLISVIVPVYNAETYLESAIQSVLDQTFGDFELIAVDDGSKDRSLVILRQLQARDARIRILSRENTGIVGALNDGLKVARGKYIARMDSDDLSLPHRFATQINFFEKNPQYSVVASHVMLIDSQGALLRVMPDGCSTHDEIMSAFLNGPVQAIYHPTCFFKTADLQAIGGYRMRKHVEDLDLFLRLTELGPLINLPEVLLHYRQHISSIGHSASALQHENGIGVIQEARRERGLSPLNARPADPALNASDQHAKWAWWALSGKNVQSARKHAKKALVLAPFKSRNWKLMACALRGR